MTVADNITPGPWEWAGIEGVVVLNPADKPLLAAAPDLLNACEEAIALIEAGDDVTEEQVRRVMGIINIALAKAREGRTGHDWQAR